MNSAVCTHHVLPVPIVVLESITTVEWRVDPSDVIPRAVVIVGHHTDIIEISYERTRRGVRACVLAVGFPTAHWQKSWTT